MRCNIYKGQFQSAELFGKPVLYTEKRIPQESVPEGWHCYDLFGNDRDPSKPVTMENRAVWNRIGYGPFTVWQGEKALVMISSLEKTPSINYLYRIAPARDNSISWDSSMLFCGVYDAEHGALYLTKDSLSVFTGGEFPPVSEVGPSVAGEISGRINRRIEEELPQILELSTRLSEQCVPQDQWAYFDMNALGQAYEDQHPGQFIGNCYVEYPTCQPVIAYDGHDLPGSEAEGWSVRLKLASE